MACADGRVLEVRDELRFGSEVTRLGPAFKGLMEAVPHSEKHAGSIRGKTACDLGSKYRVFGQESLPGSDFFANANCFATARTAATERVIRVD